MCSMSIFALIDYMVILTQNIADQAKRARSNKTNCAKMGALVESIEPFLAMVMSDPDAERYRTPLRAVEGALNDCLRLLTTAGQMNRVLTFIKSGTMRNEFQEICLRLSVALQGDPDALF